MVSIDQLVDLAAAIAGKDIRKRHIKGPTGVRGRNSDNRLIEEQLGWSPSLPLRDGLQKTYSWIAGQIKQLDSKAVGEIQEQLAGGSDERR